MVIIAFSLDHLLTQCLDVQLDLRLQEEDVLFLSHVITDDGLQFHHALMEIGGLRIKTFQSVNQFLDGLVILKGCSDDVISRFRFIIDLRPLHLRETYRHPPRRRLRFGQERSRR